jgi:NitT/TauT family transport system substrate-binding protein
MILLNHGHWLNDNGDYLKNMHKCRLLIWVLVLFSLLLIPACSPNDPNMTTTITTAPGPGSTQTKVENIRLIGTIGPLSLPLAYMVEHNVLSSIAQKTSFSIWANPTQLQAIISGGQGDFVSLPTNSAATFYNKGVPLQLIDSSIWNILYLITSDTSLKSITDLKGKRVVVPYQGAIPDAMFRFVCQKQGLNLDKDIEIYYAPDPIQASQLLLTDQEKYVLLSEPSATSVILKGKASGLNFNRALNVKTEWDKAAGGQFSTPVAGTIALGDIKNRPTLVNTFRSEYQKAIQWMLANPVEAGNVGARALEEQGFTAVVLTESIKNIEWRYISAENARSDLENFFGALMQVSANFVGGKIPDNGFYFGQ